MVIPIREKIDKPMLYVLRRGLKEAIQQHADTVVLDMDTLGGRIDVTYDMLEALAKFPGRTVTYVNDKAISAGALISAGTEDIYLAPSGLIGDAAPVSGDGTEIDPTMKAKVVSFLKARIRSVTDGKGYRGQVVSAMIDLDYELKIGETIISPKGELLTLTAKEAVATYGDPPLPLLGAGIADSLTEVLDRIHGPGGYEVVRMEANWSEHLAIYITNLASLLMALGLLLLFIEFKTPGFGVFGISGGLLLAVVFFGHYAAGLSGHEPAIFFVIGVILLLVDVFFFPGTVIMAVTGLVLMLGALVWSMADLWPNEPVTISGDVFLRPLMNVLLGVLIAVGAFLALLRFLPQGGPWHRMVLESVIGGEPVPGQPLVASGMPATPSANPLVGRQAVALTPLFPSGQVELDGRRYEARLGTGFAEAGAIVAVVEAAEFGLIVELPQS
jgi:membrane-bound serine protease (ClpP class)